MQYIIINLLIILIAISNIQAQNEKGILVNQSQLSLWELGDFMVVISDNQNTLPIRGIGLSQIRNTIELKLRSVGINPLPNFNNKYPTGDIPILYLSISILKYRDLYYNDYIFFTDLKLKLRQNVLINRIRKDGENYNKIKLSHITTWSTGMYGYLRSYNFYEVKEKIKEFVDKFANDYYLLNPKK